MAHSFKQAREFYFSVGSNRPFIIPTLQVLKIVFTFFKDLHRIKRITRNSVSLIANSILLFEIVIM